MLEEIKRSVSLLKNRAVIKNYLDQGYTLVRGNSGPIVLTKDAEFKYEVIKICDESFINHIVCEKRPNGIIITELGQTFAYTAYSKTEKQLVCLHEKRCVFTNSKLVELFKNVDGWTLKDIYQKLSAKLKRKADMNTHFITSMEHIIKNSDGNFVQSYKIPTRVSLNGEDMSKIYDGVDGNDRLYRIYDLYRGIVNERNEKDIQNISKGILSEKAFDLRTLINLPSLEDKFVGPSFEHINQEPIDSVKEFFLQKIGYGCETKYDGNTLLKLIMHAITSGTKNKVCAENEVGLLYGDYDMMSTPIKRCGITYNDKYLRLGRRHI